MILVVEQLRLESLYQATFEEEEEGTMKAIV